MDLSEEQKTQLNNEIIRIREMTKEKYIPIINRIQGKQIILPRCPMGNRYDYIITEEKA